MIQYILRPKCIFYRFLRINYETKDFNLEEHNLFLYFATCQHNIKKYQEISKT